MHRGKVGKWPRSRVGSVYDNEEETSGGGVLAKVTHMVVAEDKSG